MLKLFQEHEYDSMAFQMIKAKNMQIISERLKTMIMAKGAK